MPRNTSITLGEHFDKFVMDKINEGRFQSVKLCELVYVNWKKTKPN